MRVLLIKTSSMGDVIHALPALSDAKSAIPDIQFDWVIEEGFAEIPRWHKAVEQVIPVALRRWRKQPLSTWRSAEWRQFRRQMKAKRYDCIIDAQGLYKSAWLSVMARGERHGYDWHSIREPLASLLYRQRHAVEKSQHAVSRIRCLFSKAFNYPLPQTAPDYAINPLLNERKNYVVLIHATSRAEKLWPEKSWISLAQEIIKKGYAVKLPWGNAEEEQRAQRIAQECRQAEVLPKLGLSKIAELLAGAKAAVAVDTGLAHLAAALSLPTIALYGPTDPHLIGTYGQAQTHLTAAQLAAISAEQVCQKLQDYL